MGTAWLEDGSQLFRELLRYFKGACLEEYWSNGVWDIETLALDIELIRAHVVTSGASYLISPLEDIPEVVLPEVLPPWQKEPSEANMSMLTKHELAREAKKVPRRGTKRTREEVSKGGHKGDGSKGLLASGKGPQVPGKGSWVPGKGLHIDAKGAQLNGKGIGKSSEWSLKGGKVLDKGVVIPGFQLKGKGSSKGLQGPNKGGPAFSKAPQMMDKSSQKGMRRLSGKGSLGPGKGMQFTGAISKAGSVAQSKASSVALSKAAGSVAFSKASSVAHHRPMLGKFARRAAQGAKSCVSKEVVEQFLDADFLD